MGAAGAAPVLAGVSSFLKGAGAAELAKGLFSGLVDFEPARAWAQQLVEAIVPGATERWLTMQLEARAGFMVRLVRALLGAEDKVAPQMAQLAALGIEDLFGVSVSPAQLAGRGGGPGRAAAIAPVGDALVRGLFGSLDAGAGITPERGYENMLRLLDRVLLFGVEGWLEANLGLGPLTKELPNFGDLDDIVARTLGLGRVTARAMRPIIDATILEPARQAINRTFTPEIPTESQAVRLLNRGIIGEELFFDYMARRGWPRAIAAEFRLSAAQLPSRSDLRAMLELGLVDRARVGELLVAQGFPPQTAEGLVQVLEQDRLRTLREALATLARDMFRDRDIEEAEARALLTRADYSEDEAEALLAVAQLERSRPRRLTNAQVEKAYELGVIDVNRLRVHYELEGYAPSDVDLLEALAVADKADREAREGRRKPIIPPEAPGALDRSVALEAHRRGILTDGQLREVLEQQGVVGPALDAQLAVAAARRREYTDALARRQAPSKGLTASSGTVEEAYVRGLVGEAELTTFYAAEGFAGRPLEVLLALRREERQEYLDKQRRAQEKAQGGAATRERA